MARPLALGATSEYACALVYEHDGPASAATGWPWLFRATQHIALSDLGLSLTLTLEKFIKLTPCLLGWVYTAFSLSGRHTGVHELRTGRDER